AAGSISTSGRAGQGCQLGRGTYSSRTLNVGTMPPRLPQAASTLGKLGHCLDERASSTVGATVPQSRDRIAILVIRLDMNQESTASELVLIMGGVVLRQAQADKRAGRASGRGPGDRRGQHAQERPTDKNRSKGRNQESADCQSCERAESAACRCPR